MGHNREQEDNPTGHTTDSPTVIQHKLRKVIMAAVGEPMLLLATGAT
jgi:hypothetical protein